MALSGNDFTIRNRRPVHLFILPDLPETEWCDLRCEYEQGMTLKEIAQKHFCDPRTIRKLLLSNGNSDTIGRQRTPTVLDPYVSMIPELTKIAPPTASSGICRMSAWITLQLRQAGYLGSERTVRNFLLSSRYTPQKGTRKPC